MSNTYKIIKSVVSRVVLLFCFFITPGDVYSDNKNLDKTICDYEKVNSPCCAVIINAKTAELVYMYNADYSMCCFPPGSLAKIWSAAVMLEHAEEFAFSASAPLKCEGKFYPPEILKEDHNTFNLPFDKNSLKYYFRCSVESGHGDVDIAKAIVNSCNVYFLTAASKNPFRFISLFREIWRPDSPVGLRLPGIPKESPLDKRAGNITSLTAIASSIGEGGFLRVSPLKVAVLYAALLENTPVLSPFKMPGKPLAEYTLPLSEENRMILAKAFSQTLKIGTLRNLKTSGNVELLGGKTGTATNYGRKYVTHGWNVIYFRKDTDRYILVTFVSKGSGVKDAAGLSQRILNEL